MSEFVNRISAQRMILQLVNQGVSTSEELFGLSKKAIERWILKNHLESNSRMVSLVFRASEKLFFLANKSQEQISDEYKTIEAEIESIYKAIEIEIG